MDVDEERLGQGIVSVQEVAFDRGGARRNQGRERSHVTQDIDIKALIRTVPDFPKPGVLFRDITTLLKHADGFHAVVEQLGAAYRGRAIDSAHAFLWSQCAACDTDKRSAVHRLIVIAR